MLAARGEDLVEACAELPEDELAELQDAVSSNSDRGSTRSKLTGFQERIARDFLEVDIHGQPREILDDLLTVANSTEDFP